MRLIDADAAIEEIKSLSMTITGLRAGKGVLNEFANEYRKSVIRVLDEQPTAYDADEAIEKLEKCKKAYHIGTWHQMAEEAILIVKGAVKDE